MTTENNDDLQAGAAGSVNEGRERRATQRALKVWANARDDEAVPILDRLTGEEQLADGMEIFTENQFLIMHDTDSSKSVVIFYGGKLPNMLGRSHVGNSLQRTLPVTLKGIFHDACIEAVDKGDSVHRHGMISTRSGVGVLYRGIFMPLHTSSHPARIYVFGAFSNEAGGAELLAA